MIKVVTDTYINPLINDGWKRVVTYGIDEQGKIYKVLQNETGNICDKPVDLAPCKYTYSATEIESEIE